MSSLYSKENGYHYKVIYDIKHTRKDSTLFGYLTTQQVHFPSLKSAHNYAQSMYGKKTTKFEVIGRPAIERII